jgi:hypothetical protein
MTLVNGGLLLGGLLAAAIPILIHLLFRRRRAPIDWAAMDILREALRRQQQRIRLEQLLLLAVRCLVFALAGLALARPVLEQAGLIAGGSARVVTVVLDDGVAMQAIGADRTAAFERTKRDAAALVRTLPAGDRVGVVLASRPARGLVLPHTTDRDAVARAIEAADPSFAATDFAAALSVAGEAIGREASSEHLVVLASAFRLGSLDPSSAQPGPLVPSGVSAERTPRIVALAPDDGDLANVSITAIEAQRSIDDDSITVGVRLARSGGGNAAMSARVALEGDGTAETPPRTVRFDAGQSTARVEFVLRPSSDAPRVGHGGLLARLVPTEGGDALAADDVHAAIFDARTATRVGIVARRTFASGAEIDLVPASRWIARALMPVDQPGLEVAEIEPATLDGRTLRDLDAVVLPRPETLPPERWSDLRSFVDGGGLLVVMPSSEADVQRWTDAFVAAFEPAWQIASEATVFETPVGFAAEQPQRDASTAVFRAVDAELPDLLRPIEVLRRVEVRNAPTSDIVLLLADGSPFLLLGAAGTALDGAGTDAASRQRPTSRGLVAFITAAPELAWTNLPAKPFMVPFTQELVRRSLAKIGDAERLVVADRPVVALRDAVELVGGDGRRRSIAAGGLVDGALDRPGIWSALDAADRTVGGLAVNIDPRATRLAPLSREAIATWCAPIGPVDFGDAEALAARIVPSKDTIGAAVWLLGALLVLVLLETILARRFSRAADVRGTALDPGIASTTLRGAALGDGRAA